MAAKAKAGNAAVHPVAQGLFEPIGRLRLLSGRDVQGVDAGEVAQASLCERSRLFQDISLANLASSKRPDRGLALIVGSVAYGESGPLGRMHERVIEAGLLKRELLMFLQYFRFRGERGGVKHRGGLLGCRDGAVTGFAGVCAGIEASSGISFGWPPASVGPDPVARSQADAAPGGRLRTSRQRSDECHSQDQS